MESLDYRLNPLYTIRECSTCGALYSKSCGCSKGGLVDKFVRDPNKTPDSSQQPPQDCVKCGNPVEGPSCQGCALWRKKLKEVWFTIFHKNGIYQDLLNTSESSDDNTNIVNAPQEPFVVKQDPGENSSQNPPQIDHDCCYECGDSLDGILSTMHLILILLSLPLSSLFDEDFTSSDESFSEEDVPNENFKIFSNPLFDLDEEITSTKVDQIDDEVLENTNSIPPGIEYPYIPVDVPNILPTHPALLIDFDFIPSPNDLGSDLDVSSPFGDSNKIYDPGICIEVESTRILATLSPVINTVNFHFHRKMMTSLHITCVLDSKEKSPSSPSHRGFKASKLFHQKSPMLIHGDNTPDLGVRHLHFYPP
ncbi:hypothetical protein Tco_1226144 [Tanacetum coccineum]